jgi:hypothetical protein
VLATAHILVAVVVLVLVLYLTPLVFLMAAQVCALPLLDNVFFMLVAVAALQMPH